MKEQSTTRGVAILSVAGIAVKLLSLIYVPLLTGIIGDDGFGVYNTTYQVFTWVYAMTNIGMQPAIAKVVSELDERGNPKDALRAFKIARSLLLLIGIIGTLALIIFAKPISLLSENPKSMYSLMTLAPTMTVTSVLVAYRGYFQGRNLITPIGISQILEQIINVFLSLFCAYILFNTISFEAGVAGATIGTSIGALIAVLYLVYIYRANKYFKIPTSKQFVEKRHSTKYLVKKVLMYGLPITLSAGVQNFGALVDTINARIRLGVGGFENASIDTLIGQLGKYQALANVPLVFITAIGTVMLPIISRALINKNRDLIRERISFAFKLGFIITIPAGMGLTILSHTIYNFVYYNRTGGYELLYYGAFITVLMGVIQLQATILQSLNKFYPVVITLLIGLTIKIGLNYVLIANPSINIYGAIIGGYIGYGITFLLNISLLKRTIRRRINYFSLVIGPLAASGIMGIAVYFVNKIALSLFAGENSGRMIYALITLLAAAVGVLIYSFALILMGVITKEELRTSAPRIYNKIPKSIKRRMR